MATSVDLRISALSPEYPSNGVFRAVVLATTIDVPALILAGTLTASGLVISSTSTYKVLSIPKYSIVMGAWIVVRTVDSGGGTVTLKGVAYATPTYATTLSLAAAGVITDASGAGFTIANIAAANTGAGTDYINMEIGTAAVTTAIFDICAFVLKGRYPINAGSSGTGQ
jgi:hypothetical protein